MDFGFKKCLRFISPSLLGFQSVHFLSDMGHYTQEMSFLTLRDKKLLRSENLTHQ